MQDTKEESDSLWHDVVEIPRIFDPAAPRGMNRVLVADEVDPQNCPTVVAMVRNAVEAAKA